MTARVQTVVRKHPATIIQPHPPSGAAAECGVFSLISRLLLDKMLPLFILSLTLSLLSASCFLFCPVSAGFVLSGSAWYEFTCCFSLAFIYKELLNAIKQNLQEKQNFFYSKCKCNLHQSVWNKSLIFIVNLPQMTLWCFWLNTKMYHLCLWDKRDCSARKLTFLSSFAHPHERVNAVVSE